jgi:hypothetical protein
VPPKGRQRCLEIVGQRRAGFHNLPRARVLKAQSMGMQRLSR